MFLNKLWWTTDLKALLNEKKRVFRSGDRDAPKRIQKYLRGEIRSGKESYRTKLEEELHLGVLGRLENHLVPWQCKVLVRARRGSSPQLCCTTPTKNQISREEKEQDNC